MRKNPVPESVWKPIAVRIAAENNLTYLQLLYGNTRQCFFIPRALFWLELRTPTDTRPAYSLPAIAEISGHHHSAVHSALKSPTLGKPFGKYDPEALPARVRDAAASIRVGRIPADIIGKEFGELTVLERAPCPAYHKRKTIHWKCRCRCGAETIVRGNNLTAGNTLTCGQKHFRPAPPKENVNWWGGQKKKPKAAMPERLAS